LGRDCQQLDGHGHRAHASTPFRQTPQGITPCEGVSQQELVSIGPGGVGILLAVAGIWSFRSAEIKRANLLNDLGMEIEFKQHQIAQVDAQRAGLDRAIQELG
jgi:hypothetical protein